MSILFPSTFHYSISWGATRSYEFSRKLIERGHKVTLVCGETAKLDLPSTESKDVFRGDIDGIDVIQINSVL